MAQTFVRPVRDRVIVKRLEDNENERTEAGLYIPGTAKQALVRGVVVAVGDGPSPDNYEGPAVSKGDILHYPENVGVDVKFGLEVFRVLAYDQAFVIESAAGVEEMDLVFGTREAAAEMTETLH